MLVAYAFSDERAMVQRVGRTLTRILLDQFGASLADLPSCKAHFLFPWRWLSHLMPLHSSSDASVMVW